MKKPILQSEIGAYHWTLILIGAVFITFIGFMAVTSALQKQHPISAWIFGIMTFLLVVFSLLSPWIYYHILIYDNHIEFISLGGLIKRKVRRKDLVSYRLYLKRVKVGSYKVLKIFTKDGHYTIGSNVYGNFEQLQRVLTAGLPRKDRPEKPTLTLEKLLEPYLIQPLEKHLKPYLIRVLDNRLKPYLIALFVLVLIGGCWWIGSIRYPTAESWTVAYAATLLEKPVVKTDVSRNRKPYLTAVLAEHPDLIFAMRIRRVHATELTERVAEQTAGDSVIIWLDPLDYNSHITKESNLFMENRDFGSIRKVEVFGLAIKSGDGYQILRTYEPHIWYERRTNLLSFLIIMGLIAWAYHFNK